MASFNKKETVIYEVARTTDKIEIENGTILFEDNRFELQDIDALIDILQDIKNFHPVKVTQGPLQNKKVFINKTPFYHPWSESEWPLAGPKSFTTVKVIKDLSSCKNLVIEQDGVNWLIARECVTLLEGFQDG